MPVLAPCNQKIDAFCRFRSVSCLVLFHCRFLIPFDFTWHLNGNGKFIILCVLCLPRSSRRCYWVAQAKPRVTGQARGEYKLTYLHSKAGTFSLAESLMDQLKNCKKDIAEIERTLKALIKSLENKHLNPCLPC